jgi:hypothetical protein
VLARVNRRWATPPHALQALRDAEAGGWEAEPPVVMATAVQVEQDYGYDCPDPVMVLHAVPLQPELVRPLMHLV